MNNSYDISERAKHLLHILVQRYITEGQPVSSKMLAEGKALALSSASIRHIMADLEEHGFLSSPHTSAGRIPTTQAYRLFVDTLLTTENTDTIATNEIHDAMPADTDTKGLVTSVSNLLSDFTHLAGIVTVPKVEHMALRQVEFLALSGNRVLVILVVNGQEVQNRIIHTNRMYSPSELQQAANFINQHYAGFDVADLYHQVLSAMRHDQQAMERLSQTILDIAEKTFEPMGDDEDFVVSGQDSLFDIAEQANTERLRELFDAFQQKRDILHLLERCLQTEGVQIFIGEESGFGALGDCSVVTAPYLIDKKRVGVLGVIGPTRMLYQQVIPVVDVTAKLLTAVLNKSE